MENPLLFLVTKDTGPCEVISDHLTAEERDMHAVITNVKERLANVVIAGRTLKMVNMLKHELSPFPQ